MIEPERHSKWITHLWPVKIEHSERIQTLREAAGSLPLYEQYVSGGFREAWMELAALGDAIWLDPVAADALGVCYETMHRARTNIEVLVGALQAEGYEFRPTVYSPYWRKSHKMQKWVEAHAESSRLVLASMQQPLMNLPAPARGQMNADRERRLPQAIETKHRIHRDRWSSGGPAEEMGTGGPVFGWKVPNGSSAGSVSVDRIGRATAAAVGHYRLNDRRTRRPPPPANAPSSAGPPLLQRSRKRSLGEVAG